MTGSVRWPFFLVALYLLGGGGLLGGVGLLGAAVLAQDTESVDAERAVATEPAADAGQSPSGPQADVLPLSEHEQALLEDFDAKRKTWAQTLVEMKAIQVRYNNSVDRSPASMQRFYELRNRARGELQSAYDAAVLFYAQRPDDYITGSFIATTLDYRRTRSYYDDCFAGAKLLLDAGVRYPKLEQMAARAALIDGQIDEVMPIYEKFLETNDVKELEQIDHAVAALAGAIGTDGTYAEMWQAEQEQRQRDAEQDDLPQVVLQTTAGDVVIELFEDQAPNTVANFIQLVESGYYDESEFYQVIADLLAQGGDPSGDGSGTSGKFIPDEHDRPDRRGAFRGSLLMAKRPVDG